MLGRPEGCVCVCVNIRHNHLVWGRMWLMCVLSKGNFYCSDVAPSRFMRLNGDLKYVSPNEALFGRNYKMTQMKQLL